MKIKSDQFKNAIILITFGVVLIWALENLNNLWTVLLVLLSIASPFMIGIAIAFVMNVPMRFFEKTILKRLRQNIKRPISYIITLFLFVFIIFITLFIVVPELYKSFQELVNRAPQAWNNFLNWFETTALIENEYIAKFIKDITIDWKDIEQRGLNLLSARASDWLLSTFSVATSVLGTIISIVLGFVFSIYILLQKEKLIISKSYLPGDVVSPGFNLADIAADDEKYFVFYLPIEYLHSVNYNQDYTVEKDGKEYEALVKYIDVESEYTPKDMQTAANKNREIVKVKLLLPEDCPLKPGQEAKLDKKAFKKK
jgi:hypothetical protein